MLGTQIANYRVEQKLGEGGMGIVYRGTDLFLDRPVAIKALFPELARDTSLIERFRAEAKSQAHLNHPNIATLYSFVNVNSNWLLVMEYVEGETLESLIRRRGPIPARDAIPLFRQVLCGVGFAHRMGIIHRDLKPSNIMVNRQGLVKVLDFGIAKALTGRQLTCAGTRMGTACYMSPEQVLDRSVDARSDIYTLGVTLYEILTARLPFDRQSDFELMSDHLHTPPPRPSSLAPQIPSSAELAVLKALAKNPEQRFQNVEQFSQAFDAGESAKRADSPLPDAPAPPVPVESPGMESASGPRRILRVGMAGFAATIHDACKSLFARRKLLIGFAGGLFLLVLLALPIVQRASRPRDKSAGGQSADGHAPVVRVTNSDSSATVLAGVVTGQKPEADAAPGHSRDTGLEPQPPSAAQPGDVHQPPTPVRTDHPSNLSSAVAMYLANARASMQSGRILEPSRSNALYWAIKAKQNGSPEASALETAIGEAVLDQIEAARWRKDYDGALRQVGKLMAFYPRRTDLKNLKRAIEADQERHLAEEWSSVKRR